MGITERIAHSIKSFLGWKSLGLPQHGVSNSWGTAGTPTQHQVIVGGRVESTYDLSTKSIGDHYSKNALVFSCVTAHILRFTEAPLKDWDDEGSIRKDSPVRQLFKAPNSEQSETDFWSAVVLYAAIGGNCAIHKLRNNRGMVVGLVPYSIRKMQPVTVKGSTDWISYYEYKSGASKIRVEKEDIIHVRWFSPDPKRPWLGQAPLLAAGGDANTDNALSEYVNTVLDNDAVIPTVFTLPDKQIALTRIDDMKKDIVSKFTGTRRGDPLILEGGTTVSKLGLTLKELDARALRNVPEARICAAFSVPPIIAYASMGIENATYANLEGFDAIFTKKVTVPLWKRVADTVERGLREEFGEGINLHFDTSRVAALQENQNEVENRAVTSYSAGIRTKNESRALVGLEAVDGGDAFMLDAAASQPEQGATPSKGNANPTPLFCVKGAIKTDGFTEEMAIAHFKAYDDDAEAAANVLSGAIAESFDTLQKAVEAAIRATTKGATKKAANDVETKELDVEQILEFWDKDYFANILTEDADSTVRSLILLMLEKSAANIGEDWDNIESNFDEAIEKLVGMSTEKIVETDATVKRDVRKLLGKVKLQSEQEILDAIKTKFTAYKDGKAKAIARTTSTFATGAAQTEVWDEFGFEYEWLTQRDGVVRDTHKKADGRRKDEDGYFAVGTDKMKHPAGGSQAKENVNCRCVLIPVANDGQKRYALCYNNVQVKAAPIEG